MSVAERYLERIGFDGAVRADAATLAEIVARHVASIPFENVASYGTVGAVEAPVSLKPDAVADKLLDPDRRRGGYCLEHAGLHVDVLPRLGFTARHALGRVYLAGDGRPTARTHNVAIVTLGGVDHIVDTGLGGLTPTAPLALDRSDPQPTPHGDYRAIPFAEAGVDASAAPDLDVMVQARLDTPDGAVWKDLYGLDLGGVVEKDRIVANWFIATAPDSVFVAGFAAALAPADGSRITIAGTTSRRRGPDGDVTRTELDSRATLAAALETVHVDLGDAQLDDLAGRLGIAGTTPHE